MSHNKLPGLPDVPDDGDWSALREWMAAVQEHIELGAGHRPNQDEADQKPTKQEMIDAGITNASELFG